MVRLARTIETYLIYQIIEYSLSCCATVVQLLCSCCATVVQLLYLQWTSCLDSAYIKIENRFTCLAEFKQEQYFSRTVTIPITN